MTVSTTDLAEELVADVFWQYTDFGVAISSVKDVKQLSKSGVVFDYVDDNVVENKNGATLVKGYFAIEDFETCFKKVRLDLERLKENCEFDVGSLETVKRIVDGDDWVSIWKKHFKPLNFGKVTICPEWLECDDDGIVVKIDSDMAFGTGEHETTSMVIDEIQNNVSGVKKGLDVGCGSGILGITMAMLGVEKVVMTDIDAQAVAVAKRNASINKVDGICDVIVAGDLSQVEGKFDLCVANITAEILVFLSNQIAEKIEKNGVLILSGILNDRLKKVENKFVELGFETKKSQMKGEWSCLVLSKL